MNPEQPFPPATAVLLLAYGSPDSLADIPAYLLDIRGGRETPQPLVDEIVRRYRQIGGRSPLLAITRSAAAKLEGAVRLPVYVGMRHWHPFIKDVVAGMAADGVRQIIAICMAPHTSALSVGVYRQRLDEALVAVGENIGVDFVESWHTQPDYLKGIVQNVRETLLHFPSGQRDQVKIVFTAHSLPASILERGDPYDSQLRETARQLADELGLADSGWTLCYQSAAQTGAPWLGPQVEQVVVDLAARGERNLLVAPIGFIADQVEVLYDLDIGVQRIATEHGARVERTPMLNDGDALVAALAELVRQRIHSHA